MNGKFLVAAAALSLILSPVPDAAAADPSSRMDKVDFAAFTCADALKLKEADAPRYADAVQWVAGWLAEPHVALAVSFPAVAKAGDAWAADCAATPAAQFKDVARQVKGKESVVPLAALRCQEFLELNERDPKTGMAVIRWLDGWNARALRETKANFYYHKKHLQSAMDGCMKYPRYVMSKVTAGKYR